MRKIEFVDIVSRNIVIKRKSNVPKKLEPTAEHIGSRYSLRSFHYLANAISVTILEASREDHYEINQGPDTEATERHDHQNRCAWFSDHKTMYP